MANALQTVLCLFVQFFAPRHNAQIRFLKAQVAILRKRVRADHIVPSPEERFELLRLSSEFGHQIGPLLVVVTLPTYRRWINDAKKGRNPKKSGRSRLSQELRALVVRLGQENILGGYRRIVGELKKLGHTIATSSVRRILREYRIHPTPEKAQKREPPLPWEQFLQAHMESLVGSEFFTKTGHRRERGRSVSRPCRGNSSSRHTWIVSSPVTSSRNPSTLFEADSTLSAWSSST
jgi:putative transposase